MSDIKKFMFDLRFDLEEEKNVVHIAHTEDEDDEDELLEEDENEEIEIEEEQEPEPTPPPPMFSQEELEEANKTSFALGEAAATKKMQQSLTAQQNKLLEDIAKGIETLKKEQETFGDDAKRGALNIALEILKKLMPFVSKKYGWAEIMGIAEETLPHLLDEPRLRILVGEENYVFLEKKLFEAAKKSGFEGKLIIIKDKQLKSGECKIEWENGGFEVSQERIWKEVEAIIKRNASKKIEQTPKTEKTKT